MYKIQLAILILFFMTAIISFGESNFTKGNVKNLMNISIEDVVYKIKKEEKGRRKVLFRKHAGVYYIKNSIKFRGVILKGLTESMYKNKKVKVKVDANTMEILSLINDTK